MKARVEHAVAGAVVELEGFEASVRYEGFACEGYTLDFEAPLVAALADATARTTGIQPLVFASTATTDARMFGLYGSTPAVCFGPHAENVHGIDERVHLPSVLHASQALALFISDWCGLAEA